MNDNGSSTAPLIAVSSTIAGLGEYGRAIERAGGRSRALAFDPATLAEQLRGASGVLLSGGGDVAPARFGESSPLAEGVSDERDEFEIALVREARRRELPTLCICRGMQVANVAFGGSLIVDIAAHAGAAAGTLHQRRDERGKALRGVLSDHVVDVAAGSLLASIAGAGSVATGSRHHQALARIAADLHVTAIAAGGIAEAVEARFASPFWLGVQWHPESTLDDDGGTSLAIFTAFLDATRAGVRSSG